MVAGPVMRFVIMQLMLVLCSAAMVWMVRVVAMMLGFEKRRRAIQCGTAALKCVDHLLHNLGEENVSEMPVKL